MDFPRTCPANQMPAEMTSAPPPLNVHVFYSPLPPRYVISSCGRKTLVQEKRNAITVECEALTATLHIITSGTVSLAQFECEGPISICRANTYTVKRAWSETPHGYPYMYYRMCISQYRVVCDSPLSLKMFEGCLSLLFHLKSISNRLLAL